MPPACGVYAHDKLRWHGYAGRLKTGDAMKYFLLVIALIAAVVAALLYMPVKDGKPLVDIDQVKATIDQAAGTAGNQGEAEADWMADHGDVLFRWKNSDGQWQYGDRPPAGVQAEMVEKKSIRTVTADQPLETAAPEQNQ